MSGDAQPEAGPEERILSAAFELFDERGVFNTGMEDILARAGAAKDTFYRHFGSKDELVVAYLDRGRESMGARVEAAIRASGVSGGDSLPAIFDLFDEWSGPSAIAVASFLRVLAENGPDHPLTQAVKAFLGQSNDRLTAAAISAGLGDPEGIAGSLQILIRGATIAALEGDAEAGRRARAIAERLIEVHRIKVPRGV